MPTQGEKMIIVGIGFIIIVVGILAFIYGGRIMGIFGYYPYREYALPLGVLGVIIVVVGYALSSTPKPYQRKTGRFCSECGREIHQETSKFCPYCGTELAN